MASIDESSYLGGWALSYLACSPYLPWPSSSGTGSVGVPGGDAEKGHVARAALSKAADALSKAAAALSKAADAGTRKETPLDACRACAARSLPTSVVPSPSSKICAHAAFGASRHAALGAALEISLGEISSAPSSPEPSAASSSSSKRAGRLRETAFPPPTLGHVPWAIRVTRSPSSRPLDARLVPLQMRAVDLRVSKRVSEGARVGGTSQDH